MFTEHSHWAIVLHNPFTGVSGWVLAISLPPCLPSPSHHAYSIHTGAVIRMRAHLATWCGGRRQTWTWSAPWCAPPLKSWVLSVHPHLPHMWLLLPSTFLSFSKWKSHHFWHQEWKRRCFRRRNLKNELGTNLHLTNWHIFQFNLALWVKTLVLKFKY